MSETNPIFARLFEDMYCLNKRDGQISNQRNPVEVLQTMADIETGKDQPEPHQFRRDQHLTPTEQLRAKVVKMLHDEISGYDEDRNWDSRMSELARKVEGMAL